MEVMPFSDKQTTVPEFLSGGGEMGQLIREYDWAGSPLGPVHTWPQSLRTCIRIMLTSRQPIWIGWGKELIKFYNDPYKAIVGGKHPWALGKPAAVVWKDIWRDIDPLLRQVMEKDQGTYVESQLLIMERNGYPEETYYTFSYTPIPGDDGSTAGMICANSDDTERIISERQLKTLTQLGKNLTDAKTNDDVIKRTIATLKDNPHDFPFALFYTVSDGKAVLSETTELGTSAGSFPAAIGLGADGKLAGILMDAAETRKFQAIGNLETEIGVMPKGAWAVAPDKAIVAPIGHAASKDPYSFLVIGCNPYRLLDEKYSSFFSLVADQVGTSFAHVHAREEERKRAEALAEIDRAKTTFFSNISHEFRTPLTLLLGPIEETLQTPENIDETKARMGVAYRNALRLQRLVNTLLEFSRIEAGRMEGRFAPVDIFSLTADLASTFRSAIEKAGMKLVVLGSEIKDPVYVDGEMWERIILNLVSNAFKYSKEGTITIAVKQVGTEVLVSVSDTGIGIPEGQIGKVFDRFYRVENTDGRSKEGTGIGLSMVKELVKLHNGSITASSKPGVGSTFTVSIPIGKDHIPEQKIVEQANPQTRPVYATSFLHEAEKWAVAENGLQGETNDDGAGTPLATHSTRKYSILLADDNADMREYVTRLLNRQYAVMSANNGLDAFDKILTHKPDLVLSDIMMPGLDGFGLLGKIRNHPETKNIPVILLSARAGEEAKVEGLDAGADDYLVKPFSAKELIARIDGNIKIAKNRAAAENNLRNIIMQSPVAMTILRGKDMVIEMANEKTLELWGKKHEEVINLPVLAAFPELVPQGFGKIFNKVYGGKRHLANEMPVTLVRNGQPQKLYISFIFEPLRSSEGKAEGIMGVGIDVSDEVKARKKVQDAEEKARLAIESADLGTYEINLLTDEMITSERFDDIWGLAGPLPRTKFLSVIHPDDLALRQKAHEESIGTGNLHYEARVIWKDGSVHWVRVKGKFKYDSNKNPHTLIGVIQDITEQKLFADQLATQVKERTTELQRSNEDLQQFAHVASHDLKEPVRKIKTFSNRLQDEYGGYLPEKGMLFLEKVQHAADRMIAMIDGVLNYSKINSKEEAVETIDLNETFSQIETDLEILVMQKNAAIKKDNLPSIEGISVLIYQLFYNLVNNSLKFSKKDQPLWIYIKGAVVTDGGIEYAKITISDNGIGFRQEYAEKIFNAFTRLHSKDKYEGTGLGLALCKKIVERHNGTISATGEQEIGAVFTVTLPLKQKQNSI